MSRSLNLIVRHLSDRGLSTREISGAFLRRFSIKVSFRGGQPSLDKENAKTFARNEAEINRHFEAFLKTSGKHAGYCRRESQKKDAASVPSRGFLWFLKRCGRLLLGMVLALLLGLFWVLRNHFWKITVAVFLLGIVMILYYVGERESDWENRAMHQRDAHRWLFWTLLSGGVMLIRLAVGWFRDPEFCPGAAKGYYMGQSLNNQREIKDELSGIRDGLGE